MCYCPIAKEHCNSGRVESRPHDEYEFWNPIGGDCRIRFILEKLEELLGYEPP